MATGLDEKSRGELFDKMVRLRERKQIAEAKSCKDSSTPNEKKKLIIKQLGLKVMKKSITNIKIEALNISKAREGGGKSRKREIWIKKWIVTPPPSKRVRSKKRKREVEDASPSVEAVSLKNFKETASIVLARWKITAHLEQQFQ